MGIKAVIFDMDGILVESEYYHYLSWKAVFEKYGSDINQREDYMKFVGKGNIVAAKYLVEETKIKIKPENLVEEKKDEFLKLINQIKGRDGAKKLVLRMKEKFKVCVASSTNRKELIPTLKNTGMDLFDVVISGDDVQNVKPDPAIYLLAAKKMGVDPKECVAIEDSDVGVLAAKGAGMVCIAAPHEFTKNQDVSRADRIVKSLNYIDYNLIIGLE